MKRFLVMVGIILCGALALGFVCKSSYVDRGISGLRIVEDIEALNCNVNQIFTEEDVELFIADAREQFQNLSEDVNIYVVKPQNNLQQYNFTMLQDVEVVEVIQGDAMVNETIQIVSNGGVYDQKYRYYEYDNTAPIYYGMTNLFLPDNLYVVFVEPLETNIYTDVKHYNPAFPVFSAFNMTSDYSLPVCGSVNKIRYNDFGKSEFFCDTEETLESILDFKREVIEMVASPKQR